MKKVSGTAKRRTGKEVELVKGSVLIGFLQAQMAAIAQACTKVAQGNDLHGADELCKHYLDGAQFVMEGIFDAIGPVRVEGLLKLLEAVTHSLDTTDPKTMAKESDMLEAHCKVFLDGARKMASVVATALKNAKDAPVEEVKNNG